MKKQIIATVVAAIIIFIWQFLSWSVLQVHKAEFQHTEHQDAIMEALSQFNLKDGSYYMPNVAPGASMEEEQAFMEQQMGKPWAMLEYHNAMEANMGMNMFRGFVTDLVAAFLLIWLLMKMQNLTLSTTFLSSLAVGAIAYLTIPYLNSIWFETNTIGYVIDMVVQWGLVGLWLGWFLTRK